MPDGDQIHGKILRRYVRPYRQLCEGNLDECVTSVQKVILRDLCKEGSGVFSVIEKVLLIFKSKENIGYFYSISEYRDIQRLMPSKTQRDLLDRSIARCSSDLHNPSISRKESKLLLLTNYIKEHFDYHLRGKLHYIQEHHLGMSLAEVSSKVMIVESKLNSFYSSVAQKAVEKNSFSGIRIVQPKKLITMDENLLNPASF
jgi:hypothetical protein